VRHCRCGKSSGVYAEDGNHAMIRGDGAVPLAINNYSLKCAVAMYHIGEIPSHSRIKNGWLVDAFVYDPSDEMVKHER
jgi:hypothetical protein